MIASHRKINVAGLEIDAITRKDLLEKLRDRISRKEKTFVVTPYSEFLYASLRKPDVRHLLNSADFAIADGIGILWANVFLSKPLTLKFFYLNVIQAWWQVVWTGASILLRPSLMYSEIPEKIVGADFAWDLAELASKNNFSLYLLGARGNVAEQAAEKLRSKFPNLKIAGTSNKEMSDPTILDDINNAHPDMLLVAFKAQAAEGWIAQNLSKTNAAFAIALGGTFDYIAGAKKQPPKFIRRIGLEWLYRLVTQPSRLMRIYRGVFGLMLALVRYKVYATMPFRKNVVVVLVDQNEKILICKRTPSPFDNLNEKGITDYWEFPQGGIENKEDIIEAAKRELEEETGIQNVKVIKQAEFIYSYVWNNSTRPLFKFRRWKNKGQEQYTVFLKFTGSVDQIKLNQRELSDYKFLSSEEVLQNISPIRRKHAETVLAELKQIQV